MFRERLLEKLKLSQTGKDPEKSGKHKMSSSEEFQKGYDAIWKAGPTVNYQSTNDWKRNTETI